MASASRRPVVAARVASPRGRRSSGAPPTAPDRTAAPGDAAYERVALTPEVDLHVWHVDDLGNSSFVLAVRDADTAVAIDAWRDVDAYLTVLDRLAPAHLLALETHVHNDFVSGSRELAAARHALPGASAAAPLRFPHRPLADGETIRLGAHRLSVWATPGHTPEHVSYLLSGPDGRPISIFSGGALTVGGAGRTDILGPRLARPLAVRLYRTLHDRFESLPDETRVFPTHGGGSFCGRSSAASFDTTIGEERATNPLLRATSLDRFLAEILDQRPFPRYFLRMRELNAKGADVLGGGATRLPALSLREFDAARTAGAVTVDVRPYVEVDAGHVPGSFAVDPDGGAFSAWVGWLIAPTRSIVLVDRPDAVASATAARQLFRIGFDRVVGTLRGGFDSWRDDGRPVASVPRVSSRALAEALRSERPFVTIDVRERYEYDFGHVPGALSVPLGELGARTGEIPRDVPVAVYCARGYRAVTGASVLLQHGFTEVLHADEGYAGWAGTTKELSSPRPAGSP